MSNLSEPMQSLSAAVEHIEETIDRKRRIVDWDAALDLYNAALHLIEAWDD